MSQDLFDMMSGPPATPQQQPFPGQFNMSAPPAASMPANLLGGPNLSPMGFPGASNAAIPQSPFSQPSPSGQMMGAFSAGSNPPPAGTDQFAGLFSMQSTSMNQAAMPGALGQSASPLGQPTQQPASLFGQTGQQNTSIFGQTGQQNTSVFGQTGQQNTSIFGKTDQQNTSIFGQPDQQNTSIFGQPGQQTSIFPQTGQQNASPFGQTGQQPTSPFGQASQQNTSLFGQTGQQNASPFGQTGQQPTSLFGQTGQQNASPFGQTGQQPTSPFGQASQQNTSLFGQTGQQNTSPFGQASQQNASPFGQTGQQPTSPFGQQQTGQTTQQPLGMFGQPSQQPGSAFGVSSAPIPASQNKGLQLDGFLSMPKTPNNTPTASMMQSAAPDSFFGGLSTPSSGSNANNAGMAFPDPFASTVTNNKNSNATSAFDASDDFFAALSSPSSNTKPATSPMSPPSSAMNDDFLYAFSSSTTIANKPAPTPASDLNFDIFSSPAASASNTSAAPTSDSAFNPFGNFAAPPQPSSTSPQQVAAEPLFDAFSSTPKPSPTVPEPTPPIKENKTPTVPEPAKQPTEVAVSSGSEVKAQESTKESTTSEEISDPVLREINEKFGGRWKLLRSDPYDDYLKSVGVGLVHRKRAATGSPEQLFEVKDGQIHITIKSSIHSQYYVVKLNEETENLVEKVAQSVFCSYSNGKLYLQMTPVGDAFGKTQEVERFINDNNEHVVIHSAGIASCRRYFGKLEPLPAKGVIITPPKPADSTSTPDNTKTNGPAPSVPEATAPVQPAALQIPEVQKITVPENTWEPTPARAATPEMMILDLKSAPSPMTPGQMLLQNLHDMSDGQGEDSGDTVDNGNVLVFSKNVTEESDA